MKKSKTAPKVPPKTLRKEVIRADWEAEKADRNLPVAPGGARLSTVLTAKGTPLPVLTAIQEFLEAERRRTQKRMLALTVLFAVVLLGVIGGGLLAGMVLLGKTKRSVTAIQSDVMALRKDSAKSAEKTSATLSRLATEAQALRDNVAKGEESVGAIRREFDAEKTGRNADITKLRDTVAQLAGENALLKSNLEEALAAWPTVSNRMQNLLVEIATLRQTQGEPVAVASAARNRETLVMSILPRGKGRAMDWRLPIPE
jgi:hypothetical protein